MLDFLSYNIQAGIGTQGRHDYWLRAHRQIFPVKPKAKNLEKIADFIRPFDIVCLQEVDLGGFRSGYINQADYLKARAEFPFMVTQTNRRLGRLSVHGNIILSRHFLSTRALLTLPGSVMGRGLMIVEARMKKPLIIANTHFSLGVADQRLQFAFVDKKLQPYSKVILAGDFNCTPDSQQLTYFDDHSDLDMVTEDYHRAYPAWKPDRAIDHIFISKSFGPASCDVRPVRYSDHLPLAMQIKQPK